MDTNVLYYGDNLGILKKYVPNESVDLIYLDPPFPMKEKQSLIEAIEKKGLVKPSGMAIIHHPGEEKWPEEIGSYRLADTRKYGRSELRFYALENN